MSSSNEISNSQAGKNSQPPAPQYHHSTLTVHYTSTFSTPIAQQYQGGNATTPAEGKQEDQSDDDDKKGAENRNNPSSSLSAPRRSIPTTTTAYMVSTATVPEGLPRWLQGRFWAPSISPSSQETGRLSQQQEDEEHELEEFVTTPIVKTATAPPPPPPPAAAAGAGASRSGGGSTYQGIPNNQARDDLKDHSRRDENSRISTAAEGTTCTSSSCPPSPPAHPPGAEECCDCHCGSRCSGGEEDGNGHSEEGRKEETGAADELETWFERFMPRFL